MAFSSDFDEESDPSLCESDAPPSPAQSAGYPPSPEQNFDRPRSSTPTATDPFWAEPAAASFPPDYHRSRSPEYIAAISKSDGDKSDADSEETPAAAAAATNGRKATPAKRCIPPRAKRRCSKQRRVWKEEEEVKLLKEMAKLKESGKEPVADFDLFCQVHRYVNSDRTRAQLTDKVRRLKSKYVNTKETARRRGEDPIFPTTHEERLYDLSKVVWGCASVTGKGRSGNGKASANGRERPRKRPADDKGGGDRGVREKLVEFCLKYNGGLSQDVLRHGVSLMGSGRVEELDKLYKQVRTKEMEVEMMKAGLLREILEEVCDDGTG